MNVLRIRAEDRHAADGAPQNAKKVSRIGTPSATTITSSAAMTEPLLRTDERGRGDVESDEIRAAVAEEDAGRRIVERTGILRARRS